MRPNSGGTTDYAFVPSADERVFLFPAPDPHRKDWGEEEELWSEKMRTTGTHETSLLNREIHAAAKPENVQAACLQEQFSGPLPLRNERRMFEILAERLVEADPDRPGPLFVP